MPDDSTDIRTTTAAASSQLAWDELNTRLSAHYQRAACAGIDAAVAAAHRLQMHERNDPDLPLDDDELIEETRCHAMAYYLGSEGCGDE